jgi:hypothetical protein
VEALKTSKDKMAAIRKEYKWHGSIKTYKYTNYTYAKYANGFVEEYYGEQRCEGSIFIIPGTALLPKGLMGFIYLAWLAWLL